MNLPSCATFSFCRVGVVDARVRFERTRVNADPIQVARLGWQNFEDQAAERFVDRGLARDDLVRLLRIDALHSRAIEWARHVMSDRIENRLHAHVIRAEPRQRAEWARFKQPSRNTLRIRSLGWVSLRAPAPSVHCSAPYRPSSISLAPTERIFHQFFRIGSRSICLPPSSAVKRSNCKSIKSMTPRKGSAVCVGALAYRDLNGYWLAFSRGPISSSTR